jgi:hypothetical protein
MSAVNRSWIQSEVARSPSEGHNRFTLCVLNGCSHFKGPVQDFPKSPGANRGFLVSAICSHHRSHHPSFKLFDTADLAPASLSRHARCGNTITANIAPQRKIQIFKLFYFDATRKGQTAGGYIPQGFVKKSTNNLCKLNKLCNQFQSGLMNEPGLGKGLKAVQTTATSSWAGSWLDEITRAGGKNSPY